MRWLCRLLLVCWSRKPHHASWPCELSCTFVPPWMLQMVRVWPRAVRKDHIWKVASDWPSEGPIVISGSHENV